MGLKGKVYRMVVRPVVLYGSECWPLKKTQVQRLMVAEIRMVKWMCGFTRLDKIRNGVIRGLAQVAPIEAKMRESRLRWFRHVKRKSAASPVHRCEMINPPGGKRGRGRPKKSLEEVVSKELRVVGLTEDMTQDRRLWRDRIKVSECRGSAT